jgi:PAS domain S-box-containing protein
MARTGDELSEVLSVSDLTGAMVRAVVVTDPTGRILHWSAGAERLYGFAAHEALGCDIIELIVPERAWPSGRAAMEAAVHGEGATGDHLGRRRDGTEVWVQFATRGVRDGDGPARAVVAVSEDVTEVRGAQQAQRDLTEHLQLALEAGGLGTWRWDMATGVTTWDERLEALFGLPPGGFDGTYEAWMQALHPDDRPQVQAVVDEALAARGPYRLEHRAMWPDGTVRWLVGTGAVTVDEDGEPTGTIGCVLDATEGIELRRQLARAAEEAQTLADQERVNRERLEFLNEINAVLTTATDQHEVMANTVWAAVPRLGDWCAIHVVPDEGGDPEVEVGHIDPEMVRYARELQERFPYDADAEQGVPRVIREGVHEFHPDITDEVLDEVDAPPEALAVVRELALRSAITVPLVKRGRVLGALQFVMSSSRRRYTEDDLSLARAVAGRVAASLENRRLADRQRRIAETLQASLLPDRVPEVAGLDLAVRYWAAGEATEVGGDFWDVFRVAEGTWAAVVGDVCGKGPDAAALTGLARHSIRMSAWNGNEPVEVVRWLNRAVHESASDSFLTASYLTLVPGPEGVAVTAAAGGHPYPLLVGAGGDVSALETKGTLLGPYDDVRCEPVTALLEPGATLVLYTDGITDLPPPHALDEDQLVDLVQAAAGGESAEEVAEALHGALEALLPIDERTDDIALLVIRATG